MYTIYCLTFPNGKKYVGQTSRSIQKRCQPSLYQDNEEMYKDILYYGWKNVKIEILENEIFSREKAIEKESFYISSFDSTNKERGYNKSIRDSYGRINQEEVRKLWEEGFQIQQIADKMNSTRVGISKILSRLGIPASQRLSHGHLKEMKKIGQYNSEGKLMKVYPSLAKASSENGYDSASISRCCNNKQKTSYGFIWKYIPNEEYTNS